MARIIVNAKVYPQVTGTAGIVALARACDQAGEEAGEAIGLAPPQLELAAVAALDLPYVEFFAQHTDTLGPGSGTGWVTAEAVQATGAVGSLLNHAEHKIPHADVQTAVGRLHALNLQTLLCADSTAESRILAAMHPTYVAVEPPELIGGDISVTSADPKIVEQASAAILEVAPKTRPLCGAGVKTGKDVQAALELGAQGVLLASGVVKHSDPLAALRDLASGL